MERDFLGIGGRDSAVREETGHLGRSAVQWPFSSMVPAKHQFMNFQAAQEERSKSIVFDQLSSSGFQPLPAVDGFNSIRRSPSVVPQKHLGMDGQGIHQFQLPGYPAWGADPFSAPAANNPNEVRTFPAVSHNSFPIGTSSPFFKACGPTNGSTTAVTSLKQQHPFGGGPTVASPGVGSMTASFTPRDIIKPPCATAQLTIFYAGTVNVYDDVPLEKAQAIMFLAGNGSNMNSNVGNVAVQTPVVATTKVAGIETKNMNHTQHMNQNPATTKVAEIETKNMNHTQNMNPNPTQRNATQASSPISTASHSGAQSGSGSNATVDLTGANTTISLAPTGQQEPSKSIAVAVAVAVGSSSSATLAPRAVPQARKASLARFLEKRKERVANVAPYPSPQKTPEFTSGVDGKPVTVEASHSSSMEQSWCLSAQKNSSDSSNSLSTKLEI